MARRLLSRRLRTSTTAPIAVAAAQHVGSNCKFIASSQPSRYARRATRCPPELPCARRTLIVPYTAGSTAHLTGRITDQKHTKAFRQPFIVVSRPGARGQIGTGPLARAAPDHLTLSFATCASYSLAPRLYRKIAFDPGKDFPRCRS